MVSAKLCSDDPWCHGNENSPNFNRKFAITLLVEEICTKHRVFRVGEFKRANEICITPTPVAMVTTIWKFNRKFAITPVVYKTDSSFLVLLYGFRGRPIKLCQSNLPQTDPCCHGNESLPFSTHTDARYDIIAVSPISII